MAKALAGADVSGPMAREGRLTVLTWPLQWSPIFEVGIPTVDMQHRRLMSIANRVYGLRGRGLAFERALEELMAYTQYHFALEEQVMREAGYSRLDEHRREHELLADRVVELWGRRADVVWADLMDLLTGWLVEHILSTDQDLRRIADKVA